MRAVQDEMVKDGTLDPPWSGRTVEVLNKADLLGGVDQAPVRPGSVAVSVLTGEGLPDLLRAIEAPLSGSMETVEYGLPASDGEQLAWLDDHGEVIGEQEMDNMIHVTVRLRPADRARFEWQTKRQEGFAP